MFALFRSRNARTRKRRNAKPGIEALDARDVPAATGARGVLARRAAEVAAQRAAIAGNRAAEARLARAAALRQARLDNRLGDFVGPGRVSPNGDAFINAASPTAAVEIPTGRLGQFVGPGRVSPNGDAFINRFNGGG